VIRQLSAVLIFAALIAAVVGFLTWPGEAQQRSPAQSNVITAGVLPLFDQNHTAGLRIIRVPQAGAAMPPATPPQASYREEPKDIDEDAEPTLPQPRQQDVKPQQPRRVLPPASPEKRTTLNTPNALHDGPSPIRPLPRWRGIEKLKDSPK
jgi:hypothetical protein